MAEYGTSNSFEKISSRDLKIAFDEYRTLFLNKLVLFCLIDNFQLMSLKEGEVIFI